MPSCPPEALSRLGGDLLLARPHPSGGALSGISSCRLMRVFPLSVGRSVLEVFALGSLVAFLMLFRERAAHLLPAGFFLLAVSWDGAAVGDFSDTVCSRIFVDVDQGSWAIVA